MRNIKGNSITPCPKEISTPATFPSNPFVTVTANKGPVVITPENDMKITDVRNK
jgi:hypothetical protein